MIFERDESFKQAPLEKLANIRRRAAAAAPDDEDLLMELQSKAVYAIVEAVMRGAATVDDLLTASGMSLRELAELTVLGYEFEASGMTWTYWDDAFTGGPRWHF